MNNIPLKPPPKPGLIGRLADYISRTRRGQLHLPPWWLRDVGGSDFEATGQEFLRFFIELAHLQSNEQVLEIGCGCGRIALPLTTYLTKSGSYVGMDVVLEAVEWCQGHITNSFPNFQFFHVDLYNQRYNPTGRYSTKNYRFPFEAESFDFIFLTSVFTHLLPEEGEIYLREVIRLLRPGARAMVTFFLLNEAQQVLASQGQNDIDFIYGTDLYRVRSNLTPESAVAYDEAFLRQLFRKCGLEIIEPIQYGAWSGRQDGLSYQDILLIHKSD